MPPFSKYATASNLFSISWEAFLLEAKAYFPTTSIAGGFFMLKRTKIAPTSVGAKLKLVTFS